MLWKWKTITKEDKIMIILFFVFLIMLEGNALPIKLFPHRAWTPLAIFLTGILIQGWALIYNSLGDKQ